MRGSHGGRRWVQGGGQGPHLLASLATGNMDLILDVMGSRLECLGTGETGDVMYRRLFWLCREQTSRCRKFLTKLLVQNSTPEWTAPSTWDTKAKSTHTMSYNWHLLLSMSWCCGTWQIKSNLKNSDGLTFGILKAIWKILTASVCVSITSCRNRLSGWISVRSAEWVYLRRSAHL